MKIIKRQKTDKTLESEICRGLTAIKTMQRFLVKELKSDEVYVKSVKIFAQSILRCLEYLQGISKNLYKQTPK